MKKDTVLVIAICLCLVVVAGCGTLGMGCCGDMGGEHGNAMKDNNEKLQEQKSSVTDEKKDIYICPMGHFESDKPGDCPKCGMKLERRK